jgi:hypothetical protein
VERGGGHARLKSPVVRLGFLNFLYLSRKNLPLFAFSSIEISFSDLSSMSDLKASVAETATGFLVEGYEKIEYDFTFIDGVFDTNRSELAGCYKRWGRCLAVMDYNIFNVYGEQMQKYFDHYQIDLDIHKTMIGEKAKSIDTFLSIIDSMNKFGIFRKVRLQAHSPGVENLTAHRSPYSSSAVDSLQTLPGKIRPPAKDDFKALWPIHLLGCVAMMTNY